MSLVTGLASRAPRAWTCSSFSMRWASRRSHRPRSWRWHGGPTPCPTRPTGRSRWTRPRAPSTSTTTCRTSPRGSTRWPRPSGRSLRWSASSRPSRRRWTSWRSASRRRWRRHRSRPRRSSPSGWARSPLGTARTARRARTSTTVQRARATGRTPASAGSTTSTSGTTSSWASSWRRRSALQRGARPRACARPTSRRRSRPSPPR
mmetsp:Transcript_133122/g.413920  ORF Transcript_133122/g.413920 Transcript_133122/m.413920 type:complete len:205 (-) Transcript_133122:426-1040(-)